MIDDIFEIMLVVGFGLLCCGLYSIFLSAVFRMMKREGQEITEDVFELLYWWGTGGIIIGSLLTIPYWWIQ